MININKNILTNNNCYKAGRTIKVTGLMVHSTACPNVPASNFAKAWNTATPSGREVCVHAFCDDKQVIQTLPWNYRGWHCAGSGNNNMIGVEMCEPKDYSDKTYFDKAIKNMIELYAYLCKEFGLSPSSIISHKEGHAKGVASNHGDPDHWWKNVGYTMDNFRRDVQNCINSGQVNVSINSGTSTPQPSTSGTSCNYQIKVTAQSGLNVRATPSTSGAKVGAIACGTIKTVTKENNGWGYIGNGWISLQYTTRVTYAPSSTSVSYKVKINSSNGVNCRKEPSTTGAKVKAYANGTVLTISKESNGWGYTGEGWIKLEYTSKVSTSSTSSNKPSSGSKALGTYEVTASALRVRTGAGTGYRQKKKSELTSDGKKHANANGELLKGTRITVTQWLNGWAKTPSGWVSGDYIKKV